MTDEIQNPNPIIYKSKQIDGEILFHRKQAEIDEETTDQVDNLESNHLLY
jgi:hypothetical protein